MYFPALKRALESKQAVLLLLIQDFFHITYNAGKQSS